MKYLIFFGTLLFSVASFGQVKFFGSIKNPLNQPIAGALITVRSPYPTFYPAGNTTKKFYSSTNGDFYIGFKVNTESFDFTITISKKGYKSITYSGRASYENVTRYFTLQPLIAQASHSGKQKKVKGGT